MRVKTGFVGNTSLPKRNPDYGYNHPLFSSDMKIYSDSKVSGFLRGITKEQRVGFLNEWNGSKNHRGKIYISYDSTNKNCQAVDIWMVEYGHAKEDRTLPIFNYSIAYDTANRKALFYEVQAGSIVDVSQLPSQKNWWPSNVRYKAENLLKLFTNSSRPYGLCQQFFAYDEVAAFLKEGMTEE